MKKLAFSTSCMSVVLVALVALTSFAMAQPKMESAAQGDQSKLVQMVREATKQYLDAKKRDDASSTQASPNSLGIIPAVTHYTIRTVTWASALSLQNRYGVN
jgi:hypothetical protein